MMNHNSNSSTSNNILGNSYSNNGSSSSNSYQQQRLGLHTLDPRSMFPTRENLSMVITLIEKVEEQLEYDRARYKETKGSEERQRRNETLDYLALLNDWTDTANRSQASENATNPYDVRSSNPYELISSPAIEGNYPVIVDIATNGDPIVKQLRCIVDQSSGIYYAQVKNIRDTIYGSVKACMEGRQNDQGQIQLTRKSFAIKIYDKSLVNERRSRDGRPVQENPLMELGIQQYLTRQNVQNVMPLLACLESQSFIYAVFPFMGEELFELVSREAPLSEHVVRHLMRCFLDAVRGCHLSGICHRDISLENFLLGGSRGDTPYLIDFGLSTIMQLDPQTQQWRKIRHTGAVGKYFYMAPEIYAGDNQPYAGEPADVWSIGSCFFICLFAVPLFEVPGIADLRFKTAIVDGKLEELLRQWNMRPSPDALDLIKRMYELNPARRITISEILKHRFMQQPASTSTASSNLSMALDQNSMAT